MKKLLFTIILLSVSAVSLEAGFGKSFVASLGGSYLGTSLANAGNNNDRYEDCSFEKSGLANVKRTNKKLKERNKKLKRLERKIKNKK